MREDADYHADLQAVEEMNRRFEAARQERAPHWGSDYKDAFYKFIEELDPAKRIITSAYPEIIPTNTEQNYREDRAGKPNGIWYSCGGSWIEWCLAEDFGFPHYIHEINVVEWRLMMIGDVDGLDGFAAEYGLASDAYYALKSGGNKEDFAQLKILDEKPMFSLDGDPPKMPRNYIDWPVVAEGWAGVEINPYLWKRRLNGGMWYYGWDCASGCIWDKRAISGIRLLAVYNEESKSVEYVNE
jgi:hypothetical protein